MFRTAAAYAISPILRVTGLRFSKDYRWGTTLFHRTVYRVIDTVAANYAGGMTFRDTMADKIVIKD